MDGDPRVHFVIGPAGSGKSTVARRIAWESGAVYLDKDTLAGRATGLLLVRDGAEPSERDGNAFYRDHILPVEYETLLAVCGDNLHVGNSVVLDAPFGRFFLDAGYVVDAAARHGWPARDPIVVHVRTDGSTVLGRLQGRGEARDGWKIEHWDEFWAGAGVDSCAWEGVRHCVVDNSAASPDLSALHRLWRGLGPG